MTSDKKNIIDNGRVEEPNSRFYVKKWAASEREMAEVRKFIKKEKSQKHHAKKSITSTED